MNSRPNPTEILRLSQIARDGDDAKLKLAELLDPVVKLEARHRRVTGLSTEDAAQILRIKLLSAAMKWHPGMGTNFNSWLTLCSRNALADVARKQNRTVITSSEEDLIDLAPDESVEVLNQVDEAIKKRLQDLGKNASDETKKLLGFLSPQLPGLKAWIKSKTQKNTLDLANQLIEVYKDIAWHMAQKKGDRSEVAKALGIRYSAVEIIAKDFRGTRSKRHKWS